MPDEVEPVLVVSILIFAMLATRRKGGPITNNVSTEPSAAESASTDAARMRCLNNTGCNSLISSEVLTAKARETDDAHNSRHVHNNSQARTSSSRFANYYHSRVLAKFPFLVEMFYWAVSFFFYRLTSILAQKQYGVIGKERWVEYRVQRWYLTGADGGDLRGLWLSILDYGYSLIHIPGTVGFIAFYYRYAPTFDRFATVRRMMTLLNMCAFLIFLLYPTMPPRFLPPTFGFVDTVNAEDAQSVWMSGHYVNKLAAMPSMHFGYAFAIGCVFVYESGFLQQLLSCGKMRFVRGHNKNNVDHDQPSLLYEKSVVSRCLFLFFGLFYPCWILLTIVATANHYFLDAAVAMLCVMAALGPAHGEALADDGLAAAAISADNWRQ
ncbi:hypothetical protein SEPCBS57363_003141 [Sporothrix epigloea]|uniref:Inositolphosphotransferase Aur1/Ipt1 domain-containing protein n=1 Tax=Sporothrix epigloea TaxID=1892477 RepID=A0ABP0DNI2_9PEZI